MEILLAVAVMVVAVASWFIAASLRSQIRQNAAELEQARKQIVAQCAEQAEERLRARDHDQAGQPGFYEVMQQQISEAQAHLARHDDEMRHDQVRAAEQETATTQLGAALRQEARQREKDIARLEQGLHGKLASQLSAGLEQEARQRRQEIQQLQQALRDLGEPAGLAGAPVPRAGIAGQDLAAAPDGLRQQAERQLAGATSVLSGIDQQLSAIRRYVRAQLDREVAMTRGNKGHRVVVGGISAERPAAPGTLPGLYESFLTGLPADMLFHDPAHESSDRFYLLWNSRNGQSLEGRLETLLRGCPRDIRMPAPGLDELRGLLLALHRAGPGTLQVGPLVVVRTDRELVGTVLTATEASLLDGRSTLPPAGECRSLLGNVGPDRLADLGAWADSQR